ncbi:alpha/beta hydrolase [Candidatus Babeliales bacterium]|nr:alpha/beta hydrolase [Candidatus Babeliales bacterium]
MMETLKQRGIYESVWGEALKMRQHGEFIKLAKLVTCSIVIIHGDYDLHPFEGIRKPLEQATKNIKAILLKKCGHTPWIERFANKEFYKILLEELKV